MQRNYVIDNVADFIEESCSLNLMYTGKFTYVTDGLK